MRKNAILTVGLVAVCTTGGCSIEKPPVTATSPSPEPAPPGELTLTCEAALIRGNSARLELGEDRNCIGYWNDTNTWIEWQIDLARGGSVQVELEQACLAENAGAAYHIQIGHHQLDGVVEPTEGWGSFKHVSLGSITLADPGRYRVRVLPGHLSESGNMMNLRSVRLSGNGLSARLADQPPAVRWELVWADEFDTAGLPTDEKWHYESGANIRNNELQHYTWKRLENTRIEDGHLIIEARKEPFEGSGYTSGSLVSVPRWTYGKIEVRAKVPIGRGLWPAIWMLPPSIHEQGWPACGEIDIMEHVGHDPRVIHASIHTAGYNHMRGNQVTSTIRAEAPWESFHVYGLEWTEEKMDFLFDGKQYLTYWNEETGPEAWPFNQPFYLKLNLAIGGMWGSVQGIDDSIFPRQFIIDYVRVYRELP